MMNPPDWEAYPNNVQDVVYSLLDDDKDEYEEDTVDPHNRSLMIRKRINRIDDRLYCKYDSPTSDGHNAARAVTHTVPHTRAVNNC